MVIAREGAIESNVIKIMKGQQFRFGIYLHCWDD